MAVDHKFGAYIQRCVYLMTGQKFAAIAQGQIEPFIDFILGTGNQVTVPFVPADAGIDKLLFIPAHRPGIDGCGILDQGLTLAGCSGIGIVQ